MRTTGRLAVSLLLVVALGACDSGPEPIPKERLRSLVLQPVDVGRGFAQFDEGPQDFLDYHPGPRRDPRRFGREGGWKARFRRSGSGKTGPLLIESRADVFPDEEAAEEDIDAYEEEFSQTVKEAGERAHLLTLSPIGDRSTAITFDQGQGSGAVRYFRIAWRERNVTAFVGVSGFASSISASDALRLARAQQRRIRAAESPKA